MVVLLIGGTGNISGECAALLRRQGHDVVLLTRGRGDSPDGYRAVTADRYSQSDMRRALDGLAVDVVVNFLGFTPRELAIDHGLLRGRLRQYVFIGSTTVYATPHTRLPLTETTPLGNALSEYARNKQACEEWLLARRAEDGFPVTIVRPSHTYSRRWLPNAIVSHSYILLSRWERGLPVYLHNDGQNLWTLTAASDFAVGLAGLLGNPAAVGETFHITSDEVLTWNQIYLEIARAGGIARPGIVHVPIDLIGQVYPRAVASVKGDKAEHGVFDNAKIKRFVPEFACRTPAREGLRESVAWFRADPARQRVDPELDATVDRVLAAWRRAAG